MPIQEDPLQSKDAMAAFIQRARQAGKSDDEIRAFVKAKRNAYTPLNEPSIPGRTPQAVADLSAQIGPTKQEMNRQLGQGAAMGIGGLAGGIYGRIIGGFPGAVAGEMLGTTAGGTLTGMPPEEAAKAGIVSGATGGAVEGALNLTTRGLASMGGVQRPAVNEALSRGTGARTMFGKPGTTAEAELGGRIGTSLEPKNVGVTEGRITTSDILAKMNQQGRKVDLTPTMYELDAEIARLRGGGVGKDSRSALRTLTSLRDEIQTKYLQPGQQPPPSAMGTGQSIPPKIAVSPQDADFINQQMQDAIGNAFGKPGGKEVTRALKKVSSTHTASFRAQTGTGESATATARRLDAIETMRSHLSEKTPEGFVRSVGNALMTEGESGGQSALLALREFDPSGKLENQIMRLASKREWTGSESRIAHNIKFELVRRIPRFMAKITGVATKPAGHLAAATAAFTYAMNNP